MARTIARVPITNQVTGNDFTLQISVGAQSVPVNVILDTGSSMLVVAGDAYDPAADAGAVTTQLLQTAEFGSGSFLASVVRTRVGLLADGAVPAVALPNANLAVTYDLGSGTFGLADGIFGLAYAALDTAYRMPADTSKTRYKADQLALGKAADLDPYLSQATAAGIVSDKFAFAVQRSVPTLALADPSTDPLNAGLFVFGGGTECTDLYTGPVAAVAVVHEKYYNTNILSVRVRGRSVSVPRAAPGGRVASNSIIDSGASNLILDQGLYDRIVAMFAAVDPRFATALQNFSPTSNGCDQRQIDLTKWPDIEFVFQGSDGKPATVAVPPASYWQFDSIRPRIATTAICGDNAALAGQSNLGLPILCGHYVVFDRTASNGHGAIEFAKAASSEVVSA